MPGIKNSHRVAFIAKHRVALRIKYTKYDKDVQIANLAETLEYRQKPWVYSRW